MWRNQEQAVIRSTSTPPSSSILLPFLPVTFISPVFMTRSMWMETSLQFPENHLTSVTSVTSVTLVTSVILMGGRSGARAPGKKTKAMAVKVKALLEDSGLEIEFVSFKKKVHNRNTDPPPPHCLVLCFISPD